MTIDCLSLVFSHMNVSELKKFPFIKNDALWKRVCPQSIHVDKTPGSAFKFLANYVDSQEDLIKILRFFSQTVNQGALNFSAINANKVFFSCIINDVQETVRTFYVKEELLPALNLEFGKRIYKKHPTRMNNPFFIITQKSFKEAQELAKPFKEKINIEDYDPEKELIKAAETFPEELKKDINAYLNFNKLIASGKTFTIHTKTLIKK